MTQTTKTFDKAVRAGEGETASLTNGGINYLLPKPGFDAVQLYSASAWRLALCPALLHCVFYSATTKKYTDYKNYAIDRDDTTHVPLDGMTANDILYLGFSDPVLGVYLIIDNTNKNAVVASLDVEYSSTRLTGSTAVAFTDVAGDSDGTASGTTTLAQDGVYTWTLPTAWLRTQIGTTQLHLFSDCYWIRFSPATTLSATIDITDIIPVYKNTNYMYREAATTYNVPFEKETVGGFMFIGTATQTLNISWIKH